MKIDPCSPRRRGEDHEHSVQMLNAARAYLAPEKVRAPASRVVLTLGQLATTKWLIIGQFQFVVKDCEIVRVLTWIKAFLMTQQFVPVCWMLVFSPLISLTRRAQILFWVTTLSYAVTSQAQGLAPPTKKLAMFTKTSAGLGRRVFAQVEPKALWQTRN